MSTLKTISEALNLIETKKQNLKKAFENLQSQSSFLQSIPLSWLELDSHFTSLQHSLTERFHILQSKTLISNHNGPISKDAKFIDNPIEVLSIRNELSILCEKMDGIGLRDYVMREFEDRDRIQGELVEVFRCAPDAGEMVLQSLDGFNGDCNDKVLMKMRRVCIMLLKVFRVCGVNVSSEAREKAMKVALDWKMMLMGDNDNVLVSLGFLYLVYGFGIVSEFSMDELVEFAVMAAPNGEFIQFCWDVGFTDRVPEIVPKLVDTGKHVLAVKYVFEFNLAHKIPPVPILKAGVDEAKNIARRLSHEGKPRKEIINREIQSLKSIIAAIENYKLESEYPRASLDQRIEELKEHETNMKHKTPGKLKEHETNMKHKTPGKLKEEETNMKNKRLGSTRTLLRLQSRKKKRSMKKLQKIENKLLQTFTSVGPEAVLKNVNNNNSTICEYQQPPVNPSGLFPEHRNPPYMSSRAMPPRMVVPTPTVPSYAGPSAGAMPPRMVVPTPTVPSYAGPSAGAMPPRMVVPTPTAPSYAGPSTGPYGFAGIHTGPNGNPSLGGSQLNSSEQHMPFTYGGINLRPHYQSPYYPQ